MPNAPRLAKRPSRRKCARSPPTPLLPTRAWVRLYSGKRLDLLNPTPFDWDDSDLSIGLARTYRWGGHSAWDLPLSVAQHSLLVLALRRLWFPGIDDPRADLRELLHDADEGLLGFDCISVVKPFLGESFRRLTQSLGRAIALRYGLPRGRRRKKSRIKKQIASPPPPRPCMWSAGRARKCAPRWAFRISRSPLIRWRRSMAGRPGSPGRRRSPRSAFSLSFEASSRLGTVWRMPLSFPDEFFAAMRYKARPRGRPREFLNRSDFSKD